MRKESGQPTEYWTHDDLIGEINLHGEVFSLRARQHTQSERYYERKEIVLVAENGVRFYFHARPYILVPEVNITIDVYDKPQGSAIGKVTDSQWTGMEHREIGNAQGWYYPADATAILWEAYLFDHYLQGDDPAQDPGLKAIWEGFEQLLLTRYQEVERIATPSHEPIYEEGTLWQDFLRQQGYEQESGQAFVKKVQR